jgi:hypothetical protein
MTRWAYKMALLTLSTPSGATESRGWLDELGAEGWELVSVVPVRPSGDRPGEAVEGDSVAILKKPR